MILASHHVARALNLCSRALILHQGRLHFDEPKQTPWPAFDHAFGDFLPRGGHDASQASAPACCGRICCWRLRRRDSLLTMFFFGTLLLFVFHFAFDMPPDKVAEIAPALLWLAFLFTGTLGLAQLFQAERDNHCLDALLLSPLDRGALFLAKTGFNLLLDARGRGRRHPVILDLVQFVRVELATATLSGNFTGHRGLLCSGHDHRRRSPCAPERASCCCHWCCFP